MATGGGGGNVRQVENIFQLLESTETVKDIRAAILENLSSTKETWLIHLLVDYYFQTQSTNVMEILAELQESQTKTLMDKLQDGVKATGTRLPSLQLVLHLVYKELPWCHKLVEMPLFASILKCLETEIDVPILMTGLMMIVILLPSVPVGMGPHLQRIFDIFRRLAIFCVKKPANTPEVFVLHLQVALYSLFQRLYGMYPCSFLGFVSKFYSSKENIHVYEEVLMPMLERVRLHPKLITGQNEVETSASRWKNQETHDIIVNCSKLSLDLIEGSWEESRCPVFHTIQSVDKFRLLSQDFPYGEKVKVSSKAQNVPKMIDDATSISSLYVPSLDASAVGESPSVLIGLSTPPLSQRTTPATSFLDQGSGPSVPFETDLTPRQNTPSQTDDGEKTPFSQRSNGTFQHSKSVETKRSSLLEAKAMSVPHTTPVTPGSHSITSPSPFSLMGTVESSPLKSKPSAFVAPALLWGSAGKSLQFDKSVEEEQEYDEVDDTSLGPGPGGLKVASQEFNKNMDGLRSSVVSDTSHNSNMHTKADVIVAPKTSDSRHQKSGHQTMLVTLPMESLPNIVCELNTPDTEKLDQEVEAINERVDHFDECVSLSSSVSTLASQTDVTAESVRQFMKKVNRIRFNSLTSNSSSDFDAVSVTLGVPNQRAGRPRSCPSLKRLGLPALAVGEGSMTPRMKPKQQTSSREHMVSWRGFGRHISMIEAKAGLDYLQSEDSSDDIASYSTGSSKDTTVRSKPQPKVEDDADLLPHLPESISPAFQFIFAPSKLAVCNSCHQQVVVVSDKPVAVSSAVTAFKGNEVSLFSLMSPPELLDRHIRLGSDIHAKELTKIPLTSKESTNWTHFGGVPPADEVNILRGQILLIQNQLMYERHKRSNHAKRNRRLLRRITHIAMLEEQQKTLMNQSELQEGEIQQLKLGMRLLQEDNRRLRQTQESDEYEKLVQFRTSLKENKDLKAASVVLKNLLLTQREDNDKQQKILDTVQHKNLEHEKELEICRERLATTDKLSQRVFQLQKEVLLTQEFHQKCQEQLQQSRASFRHKSEESYLMNSLKAEIADLTRDNKKRTNLLEAYQTRLIELEEQIKSKENAVNEIKRNFEDTKSCHDEQLRAVEERCRSMLHIVQQLEAKVMELTCQLDQTAHRKMLEATRAAGGGGGGGSGGSGSGAGSGNSTAPAGSAERNRGFEPSKTGSAFSKTDFKVATEKSEILKDDKTLIGDTSDSSRNMRKYPRFEPSSRVVDVGSNIPLNVTVVVAKDEVSIASSTFTDNSSKVIHPSQHLPVTPNEGSDIDPLSDSGAVSRASYRVDSDISMRSESGYSLTTRDSGCWPKD